ncbi:beta-ketoacyl-ACP synthase II [Empedobacter falsenii]|uniref:3-oxoacyl-[acyl-carrier-protein] synthase 2 n=1 Tax=Empedobacter falsenii TaxID=343874 RepID=A0A376GDQ0_9FLAO|nr:MULTISPECIES: beta-ketoacyl-ACP synthase II [Empedobacter]MDM1039962.1 beta-ketoacyl-ACP synthase II [Empedobacter brevis]MDM1133894.1 beta-ketoacyl-ACP synthase II [Empedobacter sp. R750]STD58929.1 3-oxoacyl-[acyl-carrier-protein] synthase 2 [Empedobacter falsenii]
MKRVVVTGLGTINPLGNDIESFWSNIKAGKSAGQKLSRFDASKFRSQVACEIQDFDASKYLDKAEVKRTDLFTQYALYSASQAMEDANFDLSKIDPFDFGVIWGVGQGGMQTFENEVENYVNGDYNPRFNPFFIPKLLINMASGMISMKYGLQGINYTPVSACATGNTAIMDAFNYIRLGKAKVFVTGGSESGITPASFGGFSAMKAMSQRNDDPKTASRPFDKNRDGFVMGEGAGALILEEYEHAKARGAKIYAELVGAAMTADAYHMTSPHPEGLGAAKSMELAIEEAGLKPKDIDYLNLHATSTPVGDIAELNAVQKVFGNDHQLHVSSTKSMTGHLLGAAAAIEAIIAIKSINENIIPATINVEELDDDIPTDINVVINQPLEKPVKVAMSNAFGFGGHNSTVVFKEFVE